MNCGAPSIISAGSQVPPVVVVGLSGTSRPLTLPSLQSPSIGFASSLSDSAMATLLCAISCSSAAISPRR